jgi:hypothetical protein
MNCISLGVTLGRHTLRVHMLQTIKVKDNNYCNMLKVVQSNNNVKLQNICHVSELRCNANFCVYITSYSAFCWLINKYFTYTHKHTHTHTQSMQHHKICDIIPPVTLHKVSDTMSHFDLLAPEFYI